MIDRYAGHDRLRDGSTEAMADAAYEAWRADIRSGKLTVLISDSNEAVAALNVRARTELILEGRVNALYEVALHDGTRAAVGDMVITRRNDRRLFASRGWVRNGDRWNVIGVHRNGSVEVQRQGRRWGSAVLLPASYLAQHVDLGYAVTSHRAQGLTTDTAHVVVAPSMPRENLYVAMTRGREANTAYVAVDRPDIAHVGPRPGDVADATARSILCGILQHVGAELSAHETLAAEQDAWGSVAQLAAEYETLAAAAQHDRWAALVRASGLSPGQALDVINSDAFGPLTAELRRAEAHYVDVASLLPRVVAARGFEDAQDIAAVLRSRVAAVESRDTGAGRTRRAPRLVAGLIPRAIGPMDAAMHQALAERADLIESRAAAVLDQALLAGEPWTRALGPAPRGAAAVAWHQNGCAVAAYRDRYGITGVRPLGAVPDSTAQKLDADRAHADRAHADRAHAARAHAALAAAQRLAKGDDTFDALLPAIAAGLPSAGIRL
ncbi:TrwC relaxase [Cryobacterium sp. TMT1-3]|uniref:TrwC relaxase n=1 Tax=Cryobacterium sp. TMT1-3 TaxID=1259237 RepID=UPI0010693FBC|nr:TrwC relaxase [Cryobacterium sp. TMT1-3]TFC31357.1 TrwC relaxase [Cryobacterium sp. TMT1-3]